MSRNLDQEIDANYDFLQRSLSDYLPEHENQYVLLRSQRAHGFYDEVADADRDARLAFPDGLYSIQRVAAGSIDLGFFSHAGH